MQFTLTEILYYTLNRKMFCFQVKPFKEKVDVSGVSVTLRSYSGRKLSFILKLILNRYFKFI